MSALITITLKNGRVITGLSYRTDPSANFNPANPAQAGVAVGPTYEIQTAHGWTTVPIADIASISLQPGKPT